MSEQKKEIINIPYFTQIAWDYMYIGTKDYYLRIDGAEESLVQFTQQWSCNHYMHYVFHKNEHPDFRVVVLDDEFVEWMQEHKYERTEENMKKYLNMKRSNKELMRLIKKNGLDVDYCYFAIPIVVINRNKDCVKTKYILSSSTIDTIHEHVQSIYEQCDVCIGRQLFKMKDYSKTKHLFEEITKKYFEEDTVLMRKEFFCQNWEDIASESHVLYVPFSLKKVHESPVFTYENLYEKNPFYPELITMMNYNEETNWDEIEDIKSINEEIDFLIQKDLLYGDMFVFVDYNIKDLDEIPRYYRDIKNVWRVQSEDI